MQTGARNKSPTICHCFVYSDASEYFFILETLKDDHQLPLLLLIVLVPWMMTLTFAWKHNLASDDDDDGDTGEHQSDPSAQTHLWQQLPIMI